VGGSLFAPFLLGILVSYSAANAHEHTHGHKKMPNLVKACQKECPSAKNNDEAMECIEKLEDDAEFKKTSCNKAHLKFHEMMEKH
jgi:hypothetical protein